MTTEIREIDTGTLPDRYARGWHCLGPVRNFQDGKPHPIHASGPNSSSSPTPPANCMCWTPTWTAYGRRPVAGHAQG